jgi:DNA-binding transcriptional regulator YdaS (Cro superfamily)
MSTADLDSMHQALRRAVGIAGSQSALARAAGVTQQAVSKWLSRGKALPGPLVITVEHKTGISRHDLRPDLYPRESATTGERMLASPADRDALAPQR